MYINFIVDGNIICGVYMGCMHHACNICNENEKLRELHLEACVDDMAEFSFVCGYLLYTLYSEYIYASFVMTSLSN